VLRLIQTEFSVWIFMPEWSYVVSIMNIPQAEKFIPETQHLSSPVKNEALKSSTFPNHTFRVKPGWSKAIFWQETATFHSRLADRSF
jgi:hypothetical protein